MTLQRLARYARDNRVLIRLPFGGGRLDCLQLRPGYPLISPEQRSEIVRISSEVWKVSGVGRFDGDLVGIFEFNQSQAGCKLCYTSMAYRDYLATDVISERVDDIPFPLAIGVHATVLAGNRVVLNRSTDGKLAVPGGGADPEDFVDDNSGIFRAISREVQEETGIALDAKRTFVTGIYIGGMPTHILFMIASEVEEGSLDIAGRLDARRDAYEDICAIDCVGFDDVVTSLAEFPFVTRATLMSYMHWKGVGDFHEIPR